MRPLPRAFYRRPTRAVARDLLGKHLVRRIRGTMLVGKIVEVEAYLGASDPASHAFRGRTPRNEAMFLDGGHLYVYFTYGMHFCANVVTARPGVGHAVLLRAVEPVAGLRSLARRRPGAAGREALANGPAKLCQAFGIGRNENGEDLLGERVYLTKGETVRRSDVGVSARIGISRGREKKWRYFVKGSRCLSRR